MPVGEKLLEEVYWSQSNGEELANTVSHGVGFVAAAIGTPVLLAAAWSRGSIAFLVGTCVFAATFVLLYLGSTIYHVWPRTPFKGALQIVDHSAIFLLIAGTYTPFTMGPLHGPRGWGLLTVVWLLAAFGIALKATKGAKHRPRAAVGLYLGMGWLILVAIQPLAHAVPRTCLLWLVAGGVVYTSGVIFFLNDHRRYCHFVWHLFVLGGTGCHYLAVLSYAVATPG